LVGKAGKISPDSFFVRKSKCLGRLWTGGIKPPAGEPSANRPPDGDVLEGCWGSAEGRWDTNVWAGFRLFDEFWLFAEFQFGRDMLRLAHLGLKPEATAEGSQLKRAVGSFEVNLISQLLILLELQT
jgi:hypothetical protein